MIRSAFQAHPFPVTSELKWRFRFTVLTVFFTTILLGWGAVVTSIEAGLAVPDWPTSFNSIDPLNPISGWWTIPSILAEHGHRLMGMVVGFATIILVGWTLLAESRRWVKVVAGAALFLVIVQGTLGGLRVIWVSLDLAVVHACVAQLYFSTLVSLAFFTSSTWLEAAGVLDEGEATYHFRRIALMTSLGIYIQIILGALLRHPGAGSNLFLITTHFLGALTVTALVFITVKWARRAGSGKGVIPSLAHTLAGILTLQFLLGVIAYVLILMDEFAGRGAIPTVMSTMHMITGAFLFGSSIILVLASARRYMTEPDPQAAS